MTDPTERSLTRDVRTQAIKALAAGYGTLLRSPLLKNPGDYGLEYENITFSSLDGTPLEAWWIPGEVDYIPDYRILHEAGYNVLTYDFSESGAVRQRQLGRRKRGALRGPAMFAMQEHPGEFADVRCVLAPQPLSVGVAMKQNLEMPGFADRIDELEREIQLQVSFTFDEMTPVTWAKSVRTPTYLYQVKEDPMTEPGDVQSMYDNIPSEDKELHWIEGTTARWDGYRDFQRDPQP